MTLTAEELDVKCVYCGALLKPRQVVRFRSSSRQELRNTGKKRAGPYCCKDHALADRAERKVLAAAAEVRNAGN